MVGRVLLLADVHSNLRALHAVLEDADRWGGFDTLWLLGDVVGYGPEPNECIDVLRRHSLVAVAGNHDVGVLDSAELVRFNALAAAACRWSRSVLNQESLQFLEPLPHMHVKASFLLVHGSPRDPIWEYIVHADQAAEVLDSCCQSHVLVGHTHRPAICRAKKDGAAHCQVPRDGDVVRLDGRLLINPGSVGQPRDGDPRASYAVLDQDLGAITFHRVCYDVGGAAAAILRVGLSEALARRLHAGY